MNSLVDQVKRTILEQRLLPRDQTVIVAVSGGVDSMVLLHLLHRLAPEYRWRLVVAHLNHCLRGRESNQDEAFVRTAATLLKLPFVSERVAVKLHALAHKVSIEMGARVLRHDFLARVARHHASTIVALGHHADDQVETFFLRLMRGAGGESLSGMKLTSPSSADAGVRLVRPLLGQTRVELGVYAAAEHIAYREDASNASAEHLRNRVRGQLLPLLRAEYQPTIEATVLRVMDLVAAEADFVGGAARSWLARKRRPAFGKLHLAVQRRVLHLQMVDLRVTPSFELIEQLRSSPRKVVMVAPQLQLWRETDGRLLVKKTTTSDFDVGERTLDLTGDFGVAGFGGLDLEWRIAPVEGATGAGRRQPPGRELFDADRVGVRVHLRHWRPGDRFQPIGMSSPVKLQDFFINQKIPRARRHRLVVATTAAGDIFWVEGQRIGEDFKLTSGTRRRLQWRWRSLPGERGHAHPGTL